MGKTSVKIEKSCFVVPKRLFPNGTLPEILKMYELTTAEQAAVMASAPHTFTVGDYVLVDTACPISQLGRGTMRLTFQNCPGQPSGGALGQPSGDAFGQSSGGASGQSSGDAFGQSSGGASGQSSDGASGQPSGGEKGKYQLKMRSFADVAASLIDDPPAFAALAAEAVVAAPAAAVAAPSFAAAAAATGIQVTRFGLVNALNLASPTMSRTGIDAVIISSASNEEEEKEEESEDEEELD